MILCDTNILIEFYRDNAEVVSAMQAIGLPELAVSVITVGEGYTLFYPQRPDKQKPAQVK